MTETTERYDVIGDVHGHADKLVALLDKMGYEARGGVWTHPDRQAVFVGDLIDRGPKQVETVEIARAMVDAGTARVILGNHEFNAIAWATQDPDNSGEHLRGHTKKNTDQHGEYLAQVGEGSDLHQEHLRWFMSLPLWLDLDALRVVHACWDPKAMAAIADLVDDDNCLTDELVVAASREGSPAHQAIEHLLKGPEISIPEPYEDKEGHVRHKARFRWWLAGAAETLSRAAVIPGGSKGPDGENYPPLDDTPLEGQPPVAPYVDDVPVIYGHYWEGLPTATTSDRTACVDYSVAKGGPLVAYRWEGESVLAEDHFVSSDD